MPRTECIPLAACPAPTRRRRVHARAWLGGCRHGPTHLPSARQHGGALARHTSGSTHVCPPCLPKQDGSGSDSCPCVSERANPGCAGGRGLCVVSSRPRRAFGRGLRRARVRRSAPAAPAAACTSLAMRVCAHGQQCASLRRYRLAHWATDSGSAEHAFFDSSNPTHYEDTLPCLI
jgi:hypothetical protein